MHTFYLLRRHGAAVGEMHPERARGQAQPRRLARGEGLQPAHGLAAARRGRGEAGRLGGGGPHVVDVEGGRRERGKLRGPGAGKGKGDFVNTLGKQSL